MWIFLVSLVAAFSLLLSGCASSGPSKTINYPYQPQSVQLIVNAPVKLNYYDQQSHALTLGVIQAEQVDNFAPFLKNQDGLVNLLMNADNKWMLQRLFIQPNSQHTLVLDRNAKVQYILLIAGYADLLPAQSYQMIKIPVKTTHHGFFWLDKDYNADSLYVYINFGPQGLLGVRACEHMLENKATCDQDLLEKV